MEAHNIFFIDDKNVPFEHIHFVSQYFNSELSHSIGVYILDKKLPAPAIRDGAFYLAVKFIEDEVAKYALIDVHTQIFPRFVILLKINQKQYVMYLEDIIRYHLDEIFKVFQYDFIEAHSIKITRDSELDMDTDLENSLLEKVAKSLEGRRKGEPVRIVYDREIAPDTLQFLTKKSTIDDYESSNARRRCHHKTDVMKVPNLGRNDLEYEKITPILPYKFNLYRNNFD